MNAPRMKYALVAAGFALAALSPGLALAGPYPPAAGQPGSTAIAKDDPNLVAWATGYRNYTVGSGVDAEWQTPELALGPAVGGSFDIVSLGRRGRIDLEFAHPIVDGPGWDFAVFENSFSHVFLELAYVEVSIDGTNWKRFPNDSRTAGSVGAFGTVDPTNVDGLAGKYWQGTGTPFDLADVGESMAVYVRIRDVLGNGQDLDSDGDPIYDPYPTSGSTGFDLDAVGVFHQQFACGSLGGAAAGSMWLVLFIVAPFAMSQVRRRYAYAPVRVTAVGRRG